MWERKLIVKFRISLVHLSPEMQHGEKTRLSLLFLGHLLALLLRLDNLVGRCSRHVSSILSETIACYDCSSYPNKRIPLILMLALSVLL